MLLSLGALALAHPHPDGIEGTFPESTVAFADPFEAWDRRWLVQTELRFPLPTYLHATWHRGARADSLRVQAVLDCEKQAPRGRRAFDVICTLDDVALQAQAVGKPDSLDEATVQEWDALLTGLPLHLRVRDDRSIRSLELPDAPRGPRAEMERRALLRQLAMRLVAPLQVDLPEAVASGEMWYEPRTELMRMPSLKNAQGVSNVVHRLDADDGTWIIESKGRALQPPDDLVALSPMDVFRLQYDGVARFDPATGLMVERVWSVGGRPPATGWTQRRYHTFGQLLLIDDEDVPVLGYSGFITPEAWRDDAFSPGA